MDSRIKDSLTGSEEIKEISKLQEETGDATWEAGTPNMGREIMEEALMEGQISIQIVRQPSSAGGQSKELEKRSNP